MLRSTTSWLLILVFTTLSFSILKASAEIIVGAPIEAVKPAYPYGYYDYPPY